MSTTATHSQQAAGRRRIAGLRRLAARGWKGLAAGLRVAAAGGMANALRCGTGDGMRPNVILLTVDSLRADRIGRVAFGQQLTPNIDRLADESALFAKAIAVAPWTKPSIGSLLTGLYPTAHGAVSRGAYGAQLDGNADPAAAGRVDAGIATLAETLMDAGYATAAFTGGGFTHRVIQGRGFGHFDSGGRGLDDLARRMAAWTSTGPALPFFVWIHSYDTHSPYRDRLAPSRYLRKRPFRLGSADIAAINEGALRLDEREVSRLTGLYDAAVRRLDRSVGSLMRSLDTSGLLSGTILVFTSDHGEALYEHGLVEHSHVIYNEVLRVPLIIRAPGIAPRRVEQYVRLIDIAPTVAELADLPLTDTQGASLVPAMVSGTDLSLSAFSELEMAGRPRAIQLRLGGEDWKLILWGDADDCSLYNLGADPGELDDLAGQGLSEESVLRERLDSQVAANLAWAARLRSGSSGVELDESAAADIADRLRDLGYTD